MAFFKRLREWWGRTQRCVVCGLGHEAHQEHPGQKSDPLMAAIALEAFRTGRAVYGKVDKDGKVTMHYLDEDPKKPHYPGNVDD